VEEILMQENFRQFLDRLRNAGELGGLHQPVDIRHISPMVDQAGTALKMIADSLHPPLPTEAFGER
jgi:hypothetical protein